MSNEEIVKNIQNGTDVTLNQERLWNNNKGMVYKLIRRCGIHGEDIENDLAQQGFIGLINAAVKYDCDGAAGFLTYAIPFIRGAIYAYMANTYNHFHIPQYMRKRLRRYRDVLQDARENGQQLTVKELAMTLGWSENAVYEVQKVAYRIQIYSLDDTTKDTDNSLIEYIASDENLEAAVISGVYDQELHKALNKALAILDGTTREIIKCIYFMGFSKTSVAKMMNCSNSCVCAKIERGFQKILKSEYREELESFMWDGFRYKYEETPTEKQVDKVEICETEEINCFLI